ncbi:hypothetical protein CANARDRAFT_30448 [[Candida] arabinofermentans NRRL YB-2248]|uniref:RRM domain-containing protein n=1 Tax=[Candida] arabinofermentans NRRL YB-2248 TaxID=983967 RepID=A0A1E4SU78_9ASCO|nr:hypothetical protein CANARDRAFT_30448 [[Candida] arabinofermentans NRRL YB-2248]
MSESIDTKSSEDVEIDLLKAKMAEMEQEATKLREMQQQIKDDTNTTSTTSTGTPSSHLDISEREDIDSRSIYVGQVEYSTTPEELQLHFQDIGGIINRITIVTDKFTGNPKGFAYIEFQDPKLVELAIEKFNNSDFKGRQLKISAKRTNLPGFGNNRGGRGGRGGRARGRGAFRGIRGGRARGRGGFRPY